MEYLWGGHGGGPSGLPTVWRRCAVIVRRPQELYAWLHVLLFPCLLFVVMCLIPQWNALCSVPHAGDTCVKSHCSAMVPFVFAAVLHSGSPSDASQRMQVPSRGRLPLI